MRKDWASIKEELCICVWDNQSVYLNIVRWRRFRFCPAAAAARIRSADRKLAGNGLWYAAAERRFNTIEQELYLTISTRNTVPVDLVVNTLRRACERKAFGSVCMCVCLSVRTGNWKHVAPIHVICLHKKDYTSGSVLWDDSDRAPDLDSILSTFFTIAR